MNIQHSSRTDQWGTPPYIVEAVRKVLGTIDLDPASSAKWNQTVGATRFLTEGLESWESTEPQNVYLNPPGGKQGNKSLAGLFWQRLMVERDVGLVRHAVFMAFSAEALQNTQGKGCAPIMAFPFCVPSKRLHFVSDSGKKDAPSHSNVIVYVPGTVDYTELFREVFAPIGCVR
jgi:hypothetical protein